MAGPRRYRDARTTAGAGALSGPVVRPLCLVINWPSAAGKSTLTTATQDRAEVPLLRFGLDELFRWQVGQGVIVGGQAFEPEANRDLDARLRDDHPRR